MLEGKPGRDASARKAPPAAAQVEWTSRLLPHLSASERQNHNAWRRAFEVFADLASLNNRSVSDKQNVISSAIRQAQPRHVSLSYAELCLPSVKKIAWEIRGSIGTKPAPSFFSITSCKKLKQRRDCSVAYDRVQLRQFPDTRPNQDGITVEHPVGVDI